MGKLTSLAVVLTIGMLAGGCESQRRYHMDYDPSALRVAQRSDIGTVEAIELVLYGEPSPVKVSSIVGWGSPAGAVDPSPAGDRLRVLVRLDSGTAIAANAVDEGEFRVGDRVRVVNNRVFPA